jgi:hypothetical protein
LDYPNTEVLNAMSKLLTQNFVENDYNYLQEDLRYSLQERDNEGLKDVFNTLLASIPYDDYKSAAKQGIQLQHLKIPVQEWLYRTSILAFLRGCGIIVEAELHTFKGRPDLVISYRDTIFIIENKVAGKSEEVQAKLTEAETQIREKEYIKPYPNAICLAMVIDDTQRQIVRCEEVK